MKKWLIALVSLLIIVLFFSLNTYETAMGSKNSRIVEGKKIAKEQTNIKTITNVSLFNGKESCVVVQGKDSADEEMIVWVPDGKKPIVKRKANDGISKDEAVALLQQDRQPKEIIKAVLGMEKGVPLWEITYIDKKGLYSFYYITFETGELIKRYALPK